MTTRYYGASIGANFPGDVTEQGSTTSKAIELVVVTTTAGLTKVDVIKALEAITGKVETDNWPPA